MPLTLRAGRTFSARRRRQLRARDRLPTAPTARAPGECAPLCCGQGVLLRDIRCLHADQLVRWEAPSLASPAAKRSYFFYWRLHPQTAQARKHCARTPPGGMWPFNSVHVPVDVAHGAYCARGGSAAAGAIAPPGGHRLSMLGDESTLHVFATRITYSALHVHSHIHSRAPSRTGAVVLRVGN